MTFFRVIGFVMAGALVLGCQGTDGGDVTPPAAEILPANGAIEVALNSRISAVFSEAMTEATVSDALTLSDANTGAAVTGTTAYEATSNSLLFTPSAPLLPTTLYRATVSTAASDLAGNPLEANQPDGTFSWTFTTARAPDHLAPTLVSVAPVSGATNAPVASTVVVTFSEAISPASANASNFVVLNLGTSTPVEGSRTCAGVTCTFTPSTEFRPNVQFSVTLTTGVQDLAGNTLAAPFNSTFRTAARVWSAAQPLTGANGWQLSATNERGAFVQFYRDFTVPGIYTQIFDSISAAMLPAEAVPTPGVTAGNPGAEAVAIDASRNQCVIFSVSYDVDRTNRGLTLYSAVKNQASGVWSAPFALASFTSSSGVSVTARAALDGAGHCLALWTNGTTLFSNRGTLGGEWQTTPEVLNTTAEGSVYYQIPFELTARGPGRASLTYSAINGTLLRIYTREYDAVTGWASSVLAVDGLAYGSTSKTSFNAAGDAAMAWTRLTAATSPYGTYQFGVSVRRAGENTWAIVGAVAPESFVGGTIMKFSLADSGEMNLAISRQISGGGFGHGYFVRPAHATAWSALATPPIDYSAHFEGYDRDGRGVLIATTTVAPVNVRSFFKAPGSASFSGGASSINLWNANFGSINALMDREGRGLALFSGTLTPAGPPIKEFRTYR